MASRDIGSLALASDFEPFHAGIDPRIHERLGAHPDDAGTHFAVWAPNATEVSVIGDFNGWTGEGARLFQVSGLGVWTGHVPGAFIWNRYKYRIRSRDGGKILDKADPVGFFSEMPPATASIIWDLRNAWADDRWMAERGPRQTLSAPMSIYEVHLGSWRRNAEDGHRSLNALELAPLLIEHVQALGFTHVELLPVMEHPFFGSWGYQVTGFFAASHRLGAPQELMELIDMLHQAGIGVILDWVPAHFPSDAHGLGEFDGSHLYEHADPREGFHPDWNSLVFNYGRNEVRSFLTSSAMFWLERYHADGLRVDGVASMLYRDYSRQAGEWIPNALGGRENFEAIDFLRNLNRELYLSHPDIQSIAEESTAWANVSRPLEMGGLGFGLKWDMGWMHDTIRYFSNDPIHRRFRHNELTFRSLYAFTENIVLPLSHDEVVHGKGSLYAKMPGDDWQKRANLRLLYAYQWSLPGKKLLFMGGEFGQRWEWNHDGELDWGLLADERHAGIFRCVAELNRIYRAEPALHARDCTSDGFEWLDGSNADDSLLLFLRRGPGPRDVVAVALNFTPVPRSGVRMGIPLGGRWREIFNGDAGEFGGSGAGNHGSVMGEEVAAHGRPFSLSITLPPLAAVFFKPE